MRALTFILFMILSSCSLVQSNTSSVKKSNDFFLCFPDTDLVFYKLDLEQKLEIQSQINIEKIARNLTCEDYANYASGEENLKRINQEELDKKIGKCRYRGEPCRYD